MFKNASRNSQSHTSIWGVLQVYNNKTHREIHLAFQKELDDLQQVHQRDFQWALPRGEDLDQLGVSLTFLRYEYVSIHACSRAMYHKYVS